MADNRERIRAAMQKIGVMSTLAQERHSQWEARFEGIHVMFKRLASTYSMLSVSVSKSEPSLELRFNGGAPTLRLCPKPNAFISVLHDGVEIASAEPDDLSESRVEGLLASFLEYATEAHPTAAE